MDYMTFKSVLHVSYLIIAEKFQGKRRRLPLCRPLSAASPSACAANFPPAVLCLRIILVVLGQPDILDQARIACDFADEHHGVPDHSLGAPLPHQGQDGRDARPQHQPPYQPRPEHHDTVYPEQRLQYREEDSYQGNHEHHVRTVREHRPDAQEDGL